MPIMGTGIKPGIVALVYSTGIFRILPIGGRTGIIMDNVCVANVGDIHNNLSVPRGGGGGEFFSGGRGWGGWGGFDRAVQLGLFFWFFFFYSFLSTSCFFGSLGT